MREVILTNLIDELKKAEEPFEIIAIIGSGENDIDVAVILSGENQKFVRKFYSLIRIIKKVQTQLKDYNIFLSVFPTFRLEIFDKELSYKSLSNNEANLAQLHLLVYPTYDYFIEWEDPMIVKTISHASEAIIGDIKNLRKIGEDIKKPPFKSRVGYLLSLLFENYRFLSCSLSDHDILLREALHKTLYIVRYVTFNFLVEQNCNIRDILTWEKINNNKHKIKDKRLLNLFEKAYLWRKQSYIPSQDDLLKFNEEILKLLEDWSIKKGS
ncbi:hypothetical protein CW713_03950 [Methanophagales archaeon]|nr:MAG: hypothetical protein CW713_03950 [Methanophagales archaeon]